MKFNIKYIFILSVFIWLSCTEPFDFGIQPEPIDIIDGKISTITGRSYIRIYEFLNDSTQSDRVDLDVSVVDNNGTMIPFEYDSGRFVPVDRSFNAEVGISYRMIASSISGETYESSFEEVAGPIGLSMSTKDTFRLRLTTLNIIEEVEGVSAVARIPGNLSNQYLRLQFEHTYLNPLTLRNETTTFLDQFRLLTCDLNSCNQIDSLTVPVGNTFQQDWTFLNRESEACRIALDTLNFNDPRFCFPPCCSMIGDWPTEFRIYLESMTFPSFQYWSDIQRLRENDGLLLDTFPFPLSGNVTCNGCQNKTVGSVRAVSETFATTTRSL